MRGFVKWFNNDKGYGFIIYKDGEAYVHYSSIIDKEKGKRSLIKGEYVTFDLVETINGASAKNVESDRK